MDEEDKKVEVDAGELFAVILTNLNAVNEAVAGLKELADKLEKESERFDRAITALTQKQNMLDKELNPEFDWDEDEEEKEEEDDRW